MDKVNYCVVCATKVSKKQTYVELTFNDVICNKCKNTPEAKLELGEDND